MSIYRADADSGVYNLRAMVSASITKWQDSLVLPNRRYKYYIEAQRRDETNIKNDRSNPSSIVGILTLPAPPTNFQVYAIDKTVKMQWTHDKNCDGFRIYQWALSGLTFGWKQIDTLPKDNLSYTITAPDYGSFTYKVVSYTAAGNSPMSPQAVAYALRKPTGLTATPVSSTAIKLTWDALDVNATKVIVKFTTINSYGERTFNLPLSNAVIDSLTPSTEYTFTILANRDLNASAASDPVKVTTPASSGAPTAPSSLIGTTLSCSKVQIDWTDNSDNETGFKIERKEGTGAYSQIGIVQANVTSFTDTTVSASKTYTYRIKAYNGFGDSSYSLELPVTTPPCGDLPQAPSNLAVALTSGTSVELQWKDNSNNEGCFYLERKVEGGSYLVVKTLASNTTSTDDLGLTPDTKYYYRIRAFNNYGYSDYSNEVSIKTPSTTSKPEAPTNLSAAATSCREVSLSWKDNSVIETNFVLERKLEGNAYEIVSSTISANTTTFKDETIEEGKKYYYRIKATNANGDSDYSNEVSLTVPLCGTPPIAPSSLSARSTSPTEVEITFLDMSNNEDGFKVERKEGSGAYLLIVVLPPNTTNYKDTGLTPNTSYSYRVSAFNSYGTSSYSNEATVTTGKELTAPTKPANLTATTISQTEIKLNFTDTSDNEDGFKVERKVSGGTYAEIKTLAPNTTTFVDTGLIPDTTYYYRVRAYNSKGNSDYSNEANATTMKQIQAIVIRLYIDKTTYYVNDAIKTMDVSPIIKESRTLLPIRYVAEALGANVSWDAVEKKATITFKGTTIELWIDKNTARVNGEYKLIDPNNPKVVPIIVPPGRTMLPIRFIAENLGCDVKWDSALREVKITYPGT